MRRPRRPSRWYNLCMKWKHPPVAKIYEALGAVADGRVRVSGNSAQVFSSSGNKFYSVTYHKDSESIMANDNGSFYKGYLGYPAVAFLMCIGELDYSRAVAEMLKGIHWKDLNQKFKNDFNKAVEHVLLTKSPEQRAEIESEVEKLDQQLKTKNYSLLGDKPKPPEGY